MVKHSLRFTHSQVQFQLFSIVKSHKTSNLILDTHYAV